MGILIFGSKAVLAVDIPLLLLLLYKDREWIKENIKWGILGKFYISTLVSYGNIRSEGYRLLFFLFLYNCYKEKGIEALKNSKNKWVGNSLIFITVGGFIWNVFSPGGWKSSLIFFHESRYVIIPFILYSLIKKEEEKKIFKYILSFGVIIESLKIFYENYKIIGLNLLTSGSRIGAGEITSLFSVLIPLILIFLLKTKNNKKKIYYLSCIIFGFLTIYSVKTRGLLIGVFGIILILFLIFYKKKAAIPIILIGILLGIGLKENDIFKKRMSNLDDASNRGRIYLYRAGIYTFKNNIIFGSGSGNTQKYFIEYANNKYDNDLDLVRSTYEYKFYRDGIMTVPDTHNNILDYLGENGIFGIIMSIIIYIFIPINYIKNYFIKKDINYIYYLLPIMSFCLIGLTWSTWTRHSSGVPYFYMMFYFYFIRNDIFNSESSRN